MAWPKGRKRPPDYVMPVATRTRKGIPNKMSSDLKAMILGALSDVGGREYLAKQAIANPGSFMALAGRLLPKDVNIEATQTVTVSLEERHARSRKLLDEVFAEVAAMPKPLDAKGVDRAERPSGERVH